MGVKLLESNTHLDIKGMEKSEFKMKNSSSSSRIFRPVGLLTLMAILLMIMVFLSASIQVPYSEWPFSAVHAGYQDSTAVKSFELPRDKFLGGLLSNSFDEASCLSRYESALYWKSSYEPSAYLLEKLRSYEALHKKCGPNTELYNKSINQLKTNSSNGPLECNYVLWLPSDGLGNAIMTIISAFLYALLNDKVLLLYVPDDLLDLFCEPFPGTSWFLPPDFPVENFQYSYKDMPQSYGSMVQNKVLTDDIVGTPNVSLPAYVYIHLRHDYSENDMLFFCTEAQLHLQKFPWLLMRSNNYFIPGLFLISHYDEELNKLFPEKETVFHHLSRYLLRPTNKVWGYITRYYDAYLANAKQRVGIQIRTFDSRHISYEKMLAQVINCTLTEKILPEVNLEAPIIRRKHNAQSVAVLVTNLNTGYYETIKKMYYEHSTATGELVSVYQPTHEEGQQAGIQNHNVKALSEMFLLSFSDVLVTTAWSTFGYVAQGLGGLRPWILYGGDGKDIPCRRVMSMEPCFHSPPTCDCKLKLIDMGSIVSHVRHCEDVRDGIKLFDVIF